VYASEKEIGKYTVVNWDVSTTDQKGKLPSFSAWFEATKGGSHPFTRLMQHSSEHYQLGETVTIENGRRIREIVGI
jgi:hypothetical protein